MHFLQGECASIRVVAVLDTEHFAVTCRIADDTSFRTVLILPDARSPRMYTQMLASSAFHVYPNACTPRIPECFHSTHTRMSAVHVYPMSVFVTYPNVCIPRIPEYLHSTHARMSEFNAYQNVCISRIPEYWTLR